MPVPLVELRVRTVVPDSELKEKAGKVLADSDYNLLLTGPTRLLAPNGATLAVYLPRVLAEEMDREWELLSSIKVVSLNRGKASGSGREKRGDQSRSVTRAIYSATVGVADYLAGQDGLSSRGMDSDHITCRMSNWARDHAEGWRSLRPLLGQINDHMRTYVPDRWLAQRKAADAAAPEWVVPGTVFTTLTVNNTYSTGTHTDSGDLQAGFSTLAVARRGDYSGGVFVLANYRVGVDMQHGDLLLLDAHTHHGNTALHCPHQEPGAPQLCKPCPEGCERVSLVAYFRERVGRCRPAAEQGDWAIQPRESEPAVVDA